MFSNNSLPSIWCFIWWDDFSFVENQTHGKYEWISVNRTKIWLLHFKTVENDKRQAFAFHGQTLWIWICVVPVIQWKMEEAFVLSVLSIFVFFRCWKYVAEPFACAYAKNSSELALTLTVYIILYTMIPMGLIRSIRLLLCTQRHTRSQYRTIFTIRKYNPKRSCFYA